MRNILGIDVGLRCVCVCVEESTLLFRLVGAPSEELLASAAVYPFQRRFSSFSQPTQSCARVAHSEKDTVDSASSTK